MANELHDRVFDFLEAYRIQHPEFIYWLRERNTKNRLEDGYWFQGQDNYAFVGLYNRGGGTSMTRSFGLVFFPNNEKIGCQIENVFNDEGDSEIIDFYKEARDILGGFEKINETKYTKKLSDKNGFEVATEFLKNDKEKIDNLIRRRNLTKLFIDKESFQNKLKRVTEYRSKNMGEKKYIIVNITWNSKDWREPSDDKSGHRNIQDGLIPHESWNFDFNNSRNTSEDIYGFCQFTNAPKVEGNNNLIIFYSQNQIVGFYGKAQVLKEPVSINKQENYNLIGSRPMCVLLKNKIQDVKEKGYLEDKQRVGQIGFSYLQNESTIEKILNEAIQLNPDEVNKLNAIKEWILNMSKSYTPEEIKEMFLVFLKDNGPPSSGYYLTNIDGRVNAWASKHKFVEQTIYEKYLPEEVDDMFDKLDELEDIRMYNNTFFTPMNWYRKFCHALANKVNLINPMNMNSDNHHPLNQILFGPPGTGKTYHTISEAIKIVDPKYYSEHLLNRKKLQDRFNELLIKDWRNPNGQIAFCTFHQSFSYEDFVEGIKPKATDDKQVYYEIEDGIFKNLCRHADATNNVQALAKENLVALSQEEFNQAVFYKISLGDSTKEYGKHVYEYCINNNVISIGFGEEIDFTEKTHEEINQMVAQNQLDPHAAQSINYFKNNLKVGDYVVVSNGNSYIRALGKVSGEYKYEEESEIGFNHFRKVEWVFKNVDIPVNEFYQSNLMQKTIYKLRKESIIPSFFVTTEKKIEIKAEQKNFVIIIDEINRGNVSSIFGELITLIEPSKRAGCPEELSVVLPYSKNQFTVPLNVFVVGTMNTADRSIESLDTALRRRFSFKEMSPDSEIIKNEGVSKGVVEGINIVSLLDRINERIEKLIDKDHKIGHSYFINVNSLDDLKLAFNDKVIPLLEEYFFGDFGKIGLVLGSSFVKKEVSDFDFATFTDYDSQTEQDLKQRAVYKIKPHVDWDFKSIYETKSKQ